MNPRPERRPGVRLRRVRASALLAAPVLALSVLSAAPGPEPATASPVATPASTQAATASTDLASFPGDAAPTAVTLITGDTVHWVSTTGDGNPRVAEIEEAPRDYPVTFDQSGTQDDFYVIPTDVMAHVVSGALDMELFNIPSLIRQGLDDKSTGGELPVIVTFDKSADAKKLERDADALPAASEAQAVKGIRGAGVKVDRGKAEKFRDTVLGEPDAKRGPSAQSGSLEGAVDKVLLDQMLQIDLSESVPQIGAPKAWDAGYTGEGVTVAVLDTGIDDTHPDLAGQVVAAENFAGDGEPVDDHGHGTHVASTIAGTGAASDGARTGVAPDADLLSGKVCNAQGQCLTSDVMAGMEWAAAQGADVVNMSLGGGPTDGTDPQSQLLNDLSAETGTLFVTSAGNSGCQGRQVGSPAAADAALAVGAVDKSNRWAGFSSCGPRVGDHAVKPEITAPGVGIVAARSSTGTDMGGGATPVDGQYLRASGTSMASPHVAGAAALLAQAKPDLSWSELKDRLVSTASDGGFVWLQQGTGRVDVPAAVNSPMHAQGTLNFGGVDGQAEQDLTYTNHTNSDLTLTLDTSLTDRNGRTTDAASIALSTSTLTVPANGQASVTVTAALDASAVQGDDAVGGVVTATGEGVILRTGVGFGPPLQKVTIEVLDSAGNRIGSNTAADHIVWLVHDTHDWENNCCTAGIFDLNTNDGIASGDVPAGTYTIMANVLENEPDAGPGEWIRSTALVELEVDIDADTTVTLDSRDAVPVQVSVPRDADKRNHGVTVRRELTGSDGATSSLGASGAGFPVYVTPTPPGELANMGLAVSWTLAEPQPLQPLPWESDQRCPRLPYTCYSDTPAYIYNLPFWYENGIPDDLHEQIERRDLVEVPTRYHSDQPDLLSHAFDADAPPFDVGVDNDVRMWFEGPAEVTEYLLADDRITWTREARIASTNDKGQIIGLKQVSFDRFLDSEAGTRREEERWFEAPLRLGMVDQREEFAHPHPREDIFSIATAARRGPDGNDFGVPGYVMDNTRSHGVRTNRFASWRMWNLDTGVELESNGFFDGRPTFHLAPEKAMYRLEQVEDYPGQFEQSRGTARTTWTFTSEPSNAEKPDGYICTTRIVTDREKNVCQIQPLIQLEYDLGLDIHNRAPAGRAHRFTITAGQHSKAIDRAKVTDLSVQASFDDGETWTDARVIGRAKDSWDTGGFLPSVAPYQQFQVVLKIPPRHRTNGFVALRVQAEDANGGTVDQTVHRAFILK